MTVLMLPKCPQCETAMGWDESLPLENGKMAKCSKCGHLTPCWETEQKEPRKRKPQSAADLPPVPFAWKTKKHGDVTVTAISGSQSGGLVEIDDGEHAPCWVRGKSIFGFDVYC